MFKGNKKFILDRKDQHLYLQNSFGYTRSFHQQPIIKNDIFSLNIRILGFHSISISVSDPYHFDLDPNPDPRIRIRDDGSGSEVTFDSVNRIVPIKCYARL